MKDILNTVVHGDCLEVLRRIPSDSVDMTFADPPFNLNKRYTSYRDRAELRAYLEWCRKWLTEMVRITKPSGSIFVHNIPKWLTYFASLLNELADFKHWIAWDAPGAPLGKSLQPAHYGVLYYAKNRKHSKFYELRYPHKRCRKCNVLAKDYGGKKPKLHPLGPLVSDVWTDLHRIKHDKRRDEHPCQLPLPVLERLVLMTTDEGDIVLDPFNGTGTTTIAAKRLGRWYIGVELDEGYVQIAEKKLANETPDSRLGEAWVSWYLGDVVTIRDIDWPLLEPYFYVPLSHFALEYQPAVLWARKGREAWQDEDEKTSLQGVLLEEPGTYRG